MNMALKKAFDQAMDDARHSFAKSAYRDAFSHLETAHILGQRDFIAHTKTHWWMLRVGWVQRDFHEVRGQLLRLALIPLGHLTGRVPLGNTGGANVNAFKPMPVPTSLASLITSSKKNQTT